jgi:hypothetical protein
MLELDGGWFVQACFGETGWVANLRAAGEATVTQQGASIEQSRYPQASSRNCLSRNGAVGTAGYRLGTKVPFNDSTASTSAR